jgi:hypothetical protein
MTNLMILHINTFLYNLSNFKCEESVWNTRILQEWCMNFIGINSISYEKPRNKRLFPRFKRTTNRHYSRLGFLFGGAILLPTTVLVLKGTQSSLFEKLNNLNFDNLYIKILIFLYEISIIRLIIKYFHTTSI